MKASLFLLIMGLTIFVHAQTKPKTTNEPEHYSYPFEEWYQPLTIRVNAVLLYRKDGSGNFNLKNEEEKSALMEYLDKVNQVYSNFKKPEDLTGCYEGTDFIKDAKIRFSFNVMQVKNSYYWDYLNSGAKPEQKQYGGFSPTERWYIKPLDDSISNLNQPKAINAYFTQNGKRFDDLYRKKSAGYDLAGNLAAQLPSTTNLNRSSQVHAPNLYLTYFFQRYQATKKYDKPWSVTKGWWMSSAFSHEIGHNLGLSHSSEYYGANKCKYSLMSQKHDHPKNWLPPTEIKKIHWNLTRTNLMQFVTPESAYGALWLLTENTVWDKPRRFYHNFELAPNVTLTISESIILPPQAYVKLNKNSKIIFQGKGKIVDANGKEFKNFEKHRKATIIFN